MNRKKLLVLAIAALHLGACSSVSNKPEDANANKPATAESRDANAGATSGGVNDAQSSMPVNMPGLEAPTEKVVYFDFDRSDIRADQRAIADANVRYLMAHPDNKVRLEGHADERGSREYNLALGERRAQAVSRYFNINGVDAARINTLSYGEERPAAAGHDDGSWSQNRRVEINY